MPGAVRIVIKGWQAVVVPCLVAGADGPALGLAQTEKDGSCHSRPIQGVGDCAAKLRPLEKIAFVGIDERFPRFAAPRVQVEPYEIERQAWPKIVYYVPPLSGTLLQGGVILRVELVQKVQFPGLEPQHLRVPI